MTPQVSERSFEETIESRLVQSGPDAYPDGTSAVRETALPFGEAVPGGYRRRLPEDYDRALCLIPRDVVDFILTTQPKEWQRLKEHHGAEVKDRFLKRLAQEIDRRGALDVLRHGIKDSGCKFRLAYFRPATGLNEELQRLHAANLFAVVRQLRYSERNVSSLDLVLFLNGIPIFTAELKNPLTGQTVEDAIKQYKTGRDPREPLFAYGRCLAHFAVDPDLVYVTTHLAGPKTPVQDEADCPQTSGGVPFLIAIDVAELPGAFRAYRRELPGFLTTWPHVSGVLALQSFTLADLSRPGWFWELIPNPVASHPLPRELVSRQTAADGHMETGVLLRRPADAEG